MSLNRNNVQKSPKRRFLLILGVVTFVCVSILGVMIMFWDRLNLPLTQTQRYVFGAFFIIYAVVRFSRIILKKDDDE
ncbi:hypothetical protein GCM10023149_41360 [Mucilaginibacter gynuensis]|uniref:Uncharacterized protein n=1 Tax=Mucilaginibacter gynuensis TaxID=1302236 RepID=A0ABP8H4D5_9SPHI